ncbi:hypothetical protein N3K66_008505 [Trichothecium roseum]|uniref:Uncharacterized protein n=1 Tax=Trichothecium roseum TaxID=47278 RepID=A0ACC0UQS6_9HYPO|nr:hypothetical protein N3K66_008505 [Trichothecium roseum]
MTTEMTGLAAPPVLSTPDDQILEIPAEANTKSTLSDASLSSVYEIPRTVAELKDGSWKRVALQFPDDMLVDAPRVAETLTDELRGAIEGVRVYILADTSYSACCVDEVGAEHADADVIVHYGRACLSPTSRLPVVYVYTSMELDRSAAAEKFEGEFADKEAKVVVMADLTYQCHVEELVRMVRDRGYANVVGTDVVRDPGGLIPNRKISGEAAVLGEGEGLKQYSLFHVSDPAPSLLLALHSRFATLHVLSTPSTTIDNPTMRTAGLLRRRFARVLSLASGGVIGILVNTLSITNSLSSIDLLRRKIAAAGKKSYTVVVGRLNPAKLANFAEIEGWVVVGCWESGLVEEEGYWRPVVTPFEMEVALLPEEERVWGGEWWAGIERLRLGDGEEKGDAGAGGGDDDAAANGVEEDDVDEDESLPPEFDLRTGKLVSHSRPMRLAVRSANKKTSGENDGGDDDGSKPRTSEALIRRDGAGELASINGVASPGAEFLRSQRTWQGLGTDFAENNEASTVVEEGRSGIARGYVVGDGDKH